MVMLFLGTSGRICEMRDVQSVSVEATVNPFQLFVIVSRILAVDQFVMGKFWYGLDSYVGSEFVGPYLVTPYNFVRIER